MKEQPRSIKVLFFILSMLVILTLSFSSASSTVSRPVSTADSVTIVAQQECSKCEGKCKNWIDKCQDGGQYACYKAAACLCKCNLDAGGCGSSKEALQECYEKNEKLAKELGPLQLQLDR